MRLGKVQASGYVADVTEEELSREPQMPAPVTATATPEPAISEPDRAGVAN